MICQEKDAERLVANLIEKGAVRNEIVEAARALQASGKKVVIASKMSETIASELAKKLGFDYGIGSRERVDGKTGRILKIEELVGDFTGFINVYKRDAKGRKIGKSKRSFRVVSKIDRVRDFFKQKKEPFNPRHVTVLSDGLEGLYSRKHAKFGVLFVPTRENMSMKIARKRFLADAMVKEGPGFSRELVKTLGKPRVITQKRRKPR